MHVTKYSLDHELFCVVRLYDLHHESTGYCSIGATLERHHDYVIYKVMLWLHYGYPVATATVAGSAKREAV